MKLPEPGYKRKLAHSQKGRVFGIAGSPNKETQAEQTSCAMAGGETKRGLKRL